MFSEHFYRMVAQQYTQRVSVLQPILPQLEDALTACTEPEAALLRWYYATMPLRDAGAYPPTLFVQIARHALRVREQIAWCAALPEDVFLRDVAYYRINSENIETCGPFFFEQVFPLVHEKNVRGAVLEINYWCAQHVRYTASDERTASPLTVYHAGRGRCGEESTFLVAVLRSVGIAARQVYTPRWAHCDDNHAWVEAFVEGEWHFLGACEPEEVLDRGWFSAAATRTLLVHARAFAAGVTAFAGAPVGHSGVTCFYNAIPRYADTKQLIIHVQLADGTPAAHAAISLEILNMAEFSTLAQLQTDIDGCASLCLGKGDVLVCARQDQFYGEILCPAASECVTIPLTQPFSLWTEAHAGWHDVEFVAPPSTSVRAIAPTPAQQRLRATRLEEAVALRTARAKSAYDVQKAAQCPPEAQVLLQRASGNFAFLWQFLCKDKQDRTTRLALLQTLTEKDYLDAKPEVLEDHLQAALRLKHHLRLGLAADGTVRFGTVPEEVFTQAVLCPRIFHEEMTPYRSFLAQYCTPAQQDLFLHSPREIMRFLDETLCYHPELDYQTIFATPESALTMQEANMPSREILFVAICRTLGIPARMNAVTAKAEYYEDSVFHAAREESPVENSAVLCLTTESTDHWDYCKTWTIGCLRDEAFETLDYTGLSLQPQQPVSLSLAPGVYRLVVTTRMPNGTQYARIWIGKLVARQALTLPLALPQGSLGDFLMQNTLEDFSVSLQNGHAVSLAQLVTGRALIAFLEEGAEPTEHVLNELLEQQAAVCKAGAALVFVLRGAQALQNATLAAVLHALPDSIVCFADFNRVLEPLARQMFVDHEKLPLLLTATAAKTLTGHYACSGYHVGSIDLILKILRALSDGGAL